MKYIKNIIIALLIIIVIIILILLTISKQKQNNIEKDSYNNNADITNIDTNIRQVDNISLYYTVYDCFTKFCKTITMEISNIQEDYIEGGEIPYSSLVGVNNENDRNIAIYNQLDKEYIEDKSITTENVYSNLKFINNNFKIKKMYIIDSEEIKEFYLYIINKETKEEFLFNIILDVNNKTYSIKPMDMVDYKKIIKTNVKSIEKNNNNVFEYSNITDEQMAKNYFYDYKNNLINNIDETYDSLEDEYKKERFGNLESYKKYIFENQEEFKNITIKKYLINNYDGYTEYVCQDQYENVYIFKAIAVMDYTLLLDNYTIPTENFKTTYNQADDEKKVQMNIDKFIQMINRHDYTNSYKCISEGFKNNYFNTQDKFENYIKNTFFNYNKFEFNNIEKKGNNLYTCNFSITDLTGQNTETRKITIIMQLKDNLNFEMSFAID
jgi:hypothetical protein